MKNCVFCKIINKELSAHIIWEDAKTIVFLSLENHPLIVPKKHIADIYKLDGLIGNELMKRLIKVSSATKKAYGCNGIYITQANEKAAGQDVFHLHFHIYPRWTGKKVKQKILLNSVEKIKIIKKIKRFLK